MKRILTFCLTLHCLSCSSVAEKSKHVLLIGIDGVRVDALLAAETPNIDSLAAGGAVSWDAYAGGEPGKQTEQITRSGPGWSAILTGVWADKHGVVDNEFVSPNFNAYPHFFTRIKQSRTDALLLSVVNWTPINEHIVSDGFTYNPGGDAEVAKLAASQLKNGNPTVLFVQFEETDLTGHASGYSRKNSEYNLALCRTDSLVGILLSALTRRTTRADEDWLVLITTDHGGEGVNHGGQTVDERRIFIIANGKGVAKREISPGPGQVAIAPTVLKFLGVKIEAGWGLEGEPFGLE